MSGRLCRLSNCQSCSAVSVNSRSQQADLNSEQLGLLLSPSSRSLCFDSARSPELLLPAMPVFGGPDPTPSTSSSSLPIAPPAPSPPPSSSSLAPSSPTRTLSPAAAAALARAQPAPRPTSRAEAHSARLDQEGGEEFRPDRKDLLAYHRVLDSQVRSLSTPLPYSTCAG